MTSPVMEMESVNLEAFERLVYTNPGSPQSFEQIAMELFGILGKIRKGGGFVGVDDRTVAQLYTRLAGAITTFFTDQRGGVSNEGFFRLAAEHAILHAIFRASAYETMDHILAVFGTRDPENPESITFGGDQGILKMLLCWSLDSDVDVNFEGVAGAAPHHAAASMLGMLGVGGCHTKKSYERRLMLMRNRHLIEAVPLPDPLIQAAGDCYMHCSYTDAPDKHEVKRTLNGKLRELCGVLNVKEVERGSLVRKDRPTIVVPLEWFSSHHAMFRCYAPSILQLRKRFKVVAVYRGGGQEVDQGGKDIFDKCVELPPDAASIASVLDVVQREEPDIIYYPSLGMAAWYVALSNFRLAPIQVISPGHPATSMSKCIDYMVSDGDLFGDPSQYSEALVRLPVGTARYVPREGYVIPQRPDPDGVIRCAIPAMATKIIPPFIEALARIRAACKTPIEFHFFPNMTGLAHTVITKDLRRWFADAVVHPRSDYQGYLNNLIKCEVMLSTFPFGGTNSVIDCFLLGIPVITREGEHVHERSDASMSRRVKLPEWLITHTTDEYVAAAVQYIDSSEFERDVLRTHLQHADVEGEFFGPGPAHLQGGFLAAFERIYEQELGGRGEQQEAGIS